MWLWTIRFWTWEKQCTYWAGWQICVAFKGHIDPARLFPVDFYKEYKNTKINMHNESQGRRGAVLMPLKFLLTKVKLFSWMGRMPLKDGLMGFFLTSQYLPGIDGKPRLAWQG